MTAPLQLFARVQSLTCCRECERQVVNCPSCGRPWHRSGASNREAPITCPCAPGVETLIVVEWRGHVPNPTGEAPPQVLSDDLRRLDRCWQRPPSERSAADGRPAAWSAPQQQAPKAAPPPRPKPRNLLDLIHRDPTLTPCPPEAVRYPLLGMDYRSGGCSVPCPWPPVTIAGAYRRLFGAEPRRGRGALSQTRIYSIREAERTAAALTRAGKALAAGGQS